MSRGQIKVADLHGMLTDEEKNILRLEKKYNTELLDILKGDFFQSHVLRTEKYIQQAIQNGGYDNLAKTGPIDKALEKIISHVLFKEWHGKIRGIYPNPIAGDTGLIMDDAILSIDAKVLSLKSNDGDFDDLLFRLNQISFKNKNFGPYEIKPNLPETDYDPLQKTNLPVLSFFIGMHYTQDKKGSVKGFKLYNDNQYEVFSLTSMPNGKISRLFKEDLVYGFKTYEELTKQAIQKNNLIDKTIMSNSERKQSGYDPGENINESQMEEFLKKHAPNIKYDSLFSFKTDKGRPRVHLIINKFPHKFKNEKQNLRLVACKTGNARILKESLKNRYDENDAKWTGYNQIKLDRSLTKLV
jgi:hypothetical protein